MNTDTYIFGYLVVVPEISGDHRFVKICPNCMEERHGPSTCHDTILRSEDSVHYPDGLECVYCASIIFYPLPKGARKQEVKHNPFASFIQSLDI